MKYPLPSHAASIWLADGTIWLGLPSTNSEDRGHSVPIPATPEGLAQVLRILTARERDAANCRIGEAGSPTRAQIEEVMARRERFRAEREALAQAEPKRQPKAPKVSEAEVAAATSVLEELGLI